MIHLSIYTDGSFYQGIGGWAAVFVAKHKHKEVVRYICGNDTNTTNNRMEIVPIIQSLKVLHRAGPELFSKILLFSDSEYAIKAINFWERRRREKNVDLWTEFKTVRDSLQVEVDYKWIEGHQPKSKQTNSNVYWNVKADKLAGEARIHKLDIPRLTEIDPTNKNKGS